MIVGAHEYKLMQKVIKVVWGAIHTSERFLLYLSRSLSLVSFPVSLYAPYDVNFICQLYWSTGCLDIWSNSIPSMSTGC